MRLSQLIHGRRFTPHLRVVLMLVLACLQYQRAAAATGGQRSRKAGHVDIHGGVPMGLSNNKCDDAKTNLTIDGDYRELGMEVMFECLEGDRIPVRSLPPQRYDQAHMDLPTHVCMDKAIHYRDSPPLSGQHRPLWPVYGEYIYLPPQRWLHSMEHGAVVMLYHPCSDLKERRKLKRLVRACIRRHIITPYIYVPASQPFALLVWQHKLSLSYIDSKVVKEFIKKYGISSGLEPVPADGQYRYGLSNEAKIVSDIKDSNLCPQTQFSADEEEFLQ